MISISELRIQISECPPPHPDCSGIRASVDGAIPNPKI